MVVFIMDLMPYFTCSPENYGKTLELLFNGYQHEYIQSQKFYKHVNGDIDFFWMLIDGNADRFHYCFYDASEEKLFLKIDTLPDITVHYSDTCWFNRYMEVGDVIYNENNVITTYDPSTGQISVDSIPPNGYCDWKHRIKLHEAGTADLGGNLGVVDYITIDYFWNVYDDSIRERNTFVKDIGWVRWQFINQVAPEWQENHLYVRDDTIYQPTWTYGGEMGLTYSALSDHISSQENKPNTTVLLNNYWILMGPKWYLTKVDRPQVTPNISRLNPFGNGNVIGPYLCAEQGGIAYPSNSSVMVNRGIPASWEQFTVTKIATDTYHIQGFNGTYLCAEGGGGADININRTVPSIWEQFKLIRQPDGYYVMKCFDDTHYVCAEGGGEQPLNATRTAIGPWEKFGFHCVGSNIYNIWTFNKDVFGPEYYIMPSLSILP
jgi:hypothetical protein